MDDDAIKGFAESRRVDIGALTRHVIENWEEHGLTPLMLFVLSEKGWWPEMLDEVFSDNIGPDYSSIKLTEWINRLQKRGYDFPDNEPVFWILDGIMKEYYDDEPQAPRWAIN